MYFKAVYAYGFVEAVIHSDTDGIRNARTAGAGLGVQWRLMHYLDLEWRIGVSLPGSGDVTITFR